MCFIRTKKRGYYVNKEIIPRAPPHSIYTHITMHRIELRITFCTSYCCRSPFAPTTDVLLLNYYRNTFFRRFALASKSGENVVGYRLLSAVVFTIIKSFRLSSSLPLGSTTRDFLRRTHVRISRWNEETTYLAVLHFRETDTAENHSHR